MIGKLTERIRFQGAVLASDGAGGIVENWQDIDTDAEVYASVIAIGGAEAQAARGTRMQRRYRIIVRHRDDIDTAMRIAHGARYYDILSAIDRRGDREWLEMVAEERA
jgi:SPP1 family predicted phage head-tail adaptor